ncbi:MAG: decarboxylating 6-phosphogluconate dehydrogenase [Acidimicrobiia bacterium]|nr:decarboxylating 6-phosphogluconate dehydrogenase [Acidimicrobiia bacterium]NNF63987.1 decarboxylating 6-phosphogluconate dehydrogenase [Acidimicrobiia bacterium]
MELGMIGLGKMGANMSERLVNAGHRVVGYDLNARSIADVVERGAEGAHSLEELVSKLSAPRAIWMMVPHGRPVDMTIEALVPLLEPGDRLIDGGNTFYKDTMARATALADAGIHYVDVGTSGGIWGLAEGYSMMVGGSESAVESLRPIFEALAPATDKGWGRTGPSGAGHFVKMVHNGIEYGLMQAYAEGFAVMQAKEEFGLDLAEIADIWEFGSVVRSWLLELTADALREDPTMVDIAPFVPDSGEGRWAVAEAIDLNIATPVIALALMRRLASRDDVEFSDRLLAAMRQQFGGHAVQKVD